MIQTGCKSLVPLGATYWFGEMHGSDRWPVGSDRWAYIGSDRCYFFETLNCLSSLQCSCYWMKKTTMNYLEESCNSSQTTWMLLCVFIVLREVRGSIACVCMYVHMQVGKCMCGCEFSRYLGKCNRFIDTYYFSQLGFIGLDGSRMMVRIIGTWFRIMINITFIIKLSD